MDEKLQRALAAAARAFADVLDGTDGDEAPGGGTEAMAKVLAGVRRVNQGEGRGATTEEMRALARAAGMDIRGTAGYYAAGFLESRDGGRWLTEAGKARLAQLGVAP